MAVYEPGIKLSPDNESTRALSLDCPASKAVRNPFLLCISHLVYGIFVIAAHADKDKYPLKNLQVVKILEHYLESHF